MRHKLVKANNTTVNNIKSFRFIEQVNDIGMVRWGSCISSCIEVEVYGSRADAIPTGTVLTYYQTVDRTTSLVPTSTETDILIGVFTTDSAIPSKNTYSFIGYDNIHKLDKPFPTLATKQRPYDIFASIESLCGVTFDIDDLLDGTLSNLMLGTMDIFYSSGMTCRDFVSQFAEMIGCFARCKTNGEIEFAKFSTDSRGFWGASSDYFISPTDDMTKFYSGRSGIPVVYKENGIDYAEEETKCYGSAKTVWEDGTSQYEISKGVQYESYPMYVVENNIVYNYLEAFYDDDDDHYEDLLWEIIDSNDSYRECEIHLFPFLNPFRAGQIVNVEPTIAATLADSHNFYTYIMKMEVNDSEVIITCGGKASNASSTTVTGGWEQTETVLLAKIESLEKKATSLSKQISSVSASAYYQNGDTVTIGNYVPLAAYVTSSTKVLRIGVPVLKSLAHISSVTVDSIVGGCRGISGYLNSLSGDSNDYSQIGTVTAEVASDNMVIITVTSTNAYTNVSNNTPLIFSANDITLTFTGSGGGGRSTVNVVQDSGTGSLYIS